jgi:ribose transport system permease protein
MKRVLSFLRGHTIYALILLLAVFVGGVEIVRPGTVTPLWASNTILFAAPLAIMAGGQTLVMLTGGIDLSVASVATGAAYLLATNASSGAAPAIGLALLVGVIVGLINGIGVALLRVQPLVMTLGTGLMTGGVLIVYSQHMLASQPHVPDIIQTLGAGRVFGLVPIDLFLWLVIAALILFGLQRTGFGRLLSAVGDNREAVISRASGFGASCSPTICSARYSPRSPGSSWWEARTRRISVSPTATCCPRSPAWSSAARPSSADAAAMRGPLSAR